MTMTDINAARILAHQGNIARYRRILSTKLTELERSFVMRRLAEERKCLRRLIEARGKQLEPPHDNEIERAA
jgi:hypothetical protein